MSKGKGYILPQEPYTDDLECMLVFYPNKQEYREALIGSLYFLATWAAWERNESKGGKDAALAWKNAYRETLNMSCGQEIKQGLEAIAAAIGDVQLIVNQNGGGCCEPAGQTVGTPPEWQENGDGGTGDPQNPVSDPPNWDEQQNGSYSEYKCLAANNLVADFVETMAKYGTLSGLLTSLGAGSVLLMLNGTFLSSITTGLMAIGLTGPGAVVAIIGILVLLISVGSLALAYFLDISTDFDKQAAVCALMGAATAGEAKVAFKAEVQSAIDLLIGVDAGYFGEKLVEIIDVLLPVTVFNVLFTYTELETPAVVYDCSCLGLPPSGPYSLRFHFDSSGELDSLTFTDPAVRGYTLNVANSNLELDVQPEPFPQDAIRINLDMNAVWNALGYAAPSSTIVNGNMTMAVRYRAFASGYGGSFIHGFRIVDASSARDSGPFEVTPSSFTVFSWSHNYGAQSPAIDYVQWRFNAQNEQFATLVGEFEIDYIDLSFTLD